MALIVHACVLLAVLLAVLCTNKYEEELPRLGTSARQVGDSQGGKNPSNTQDVPRMRNQPARYLYVPAVQEALR